MESAEHYQEAVELALNGDWDGSHKIVQEYSDHYANWIHAVLHKIEGDVSNSRYWYMRTDGCQYEEYDEPDEELRVILAVLNNETV